jgi:hypothetical protein
MRPIFGAGTVIAMTGLGCIAFGMAGVLTVLLSHRSQTLLGIACGAIVIGIVFAVTGSAVRKA